MVSSGWKCISVLISIFQFLTHTTGNCLFKIFYPIVMSNVFMREKVFVCACKRETESSYGLSFVFLCVGIAWVKGGWQVFLTVEKKSQSDKWRLLDFQTLVESYDFFWKVDTNKGSPVVSCEVLETAIFSVNMRTAYISAYFFILFLFLFWGLKVLIQQPGQLGEACCDTWVVLTASSMHIFLNQEMAGRCTRWPCVMTQAAYSVSHSTCDSTAYTSHGGAKFDPNIQHKMRDNDWNGQPSGQM